MSTAHMPDTRITVNPEQCGGRPCVRGMRIRVVDVLDLLAAGLSPQQVLEELPDLEPRRHLSLSPVRQPQARSPDRGCVTLWLDAQPLTRPRILVPPDLRRFCVSPVRELGLRDATDRDIYMAARDAAGHHRHSKDVDFVRLLERSRATAAGPVVDLRQHLQRSDSCSILELDYWPAVSALLRMANSLVEVGDELRC